jgi:hypothetical protein
VGTNRNGTDVHPTETTKLIENVAFSFEMINDNTVHVVYADAEDPNRWDVRDSKLFPKRKANYMKRIESVGFKFSEANGFGWNIEDKEDASHSKIIST